MLIDTKPDPRELPSETLVARFAGSPWLFRFANSEVVRAKFAIRIDPTFEDAWDYLDGAPGGAFGGVVLAYAALWQRLERDPRPVAKRPWEALSAQTRRGYTGPMHSVFGVPRDPAAEASFYAQANSDELAILRRHPKRGTYVVRGHAYRVMLSSFGGGAWASTWQVHE